MKRPFFNLILLPVLIERAHAFGRAILRVKQAATGDPTVLSGDIGMPMAGAIAAGDSAERMVVR